MAPMTNLALAALLVLVSAVAQLPRGAAADVGASGVNPGVLISGIARCGPAASSSTIPHAGLQLVCNGIVVAGAVADDNGAFIINLQPAADDLLAGLLDNKCKVVVTTPLVACSVTPGTTTLAAPLQLVGASLGTAGALVTTIAGHLVVTVGGIISFVSVLFSLA